MEPKHSENAADLATWKARMSTARRPREQAMVLVDMLDAHMAVGSYAAEPFGTCSQLLKSASDPLFAVAVLYDSMRSKERLGDPVRWALGRLRFQRGLVKQNGHGGETMTAAEYIARHGMPQAPAFD